ncbi:MAG: dihydrolipoyl dehydrogenase [Candidatus Eisenbacteria bacterium]|nr:dihydrolipoyl dehydrogenase [Candidatus Eisenbacteria bacterium]
MVVVGGGPAGYVGALRASRLGMKTVLVEERQIGGVCLNQGCIPTKTLLATARVLSHLKEAERFGISGRIEAQIDLMKLRSRKETVVKGVVTGVENLLRNSGVEVIRGRGTLLPGRRLHISGGSGKEGSSEAEIQGGKILLAVGSTSMGLPAAPFDGKEIVSAEMLLDKFEIPGEILIVGGGAIGCEFAQMFSAFGSKVYLAEMMKNLLPGMDKELSELTEREMKKRNVELLLGEKLEKTSREGDNIVSKFTSGKKIKAKKVLLALGRQILGRGIGLEEKGISFGGKGEIRVDERFETAGEGVFAAGDCIGRAMLAHAASMEAICAVENIAGKKRELDYSLVPNCIFMEPEIAAVGMTEDEAAAKGFQTIPGRFLTRGLGRAHADGELSGFVKVLSDRKTGKILGVHVASSRASEFIHEAAVAMKCGMTAKELGETVHAHPTFSEVLMEACLDVSGDAIHKPAPRLGPLPKGERK